MAWLQFGSRFDGCGGLLDLMDVDEAGNEKLLCTQNLEQAFLDALRRAAPHDEWWNVLDLGPPEASL